MTATLGDVFRRACADLTLDGRRFALIGGLAVGVRARERTTRDVDLAIAVSDDREAEGVVRGLTARGYRAVILLEQSERGRLATARLTSPLDDATHVDLLFSSSGIEPEVVSAADPVAIFALTCPVARAGHLIALKVLSRNERRVQDDEDLGALLDEVVADDLALAREATRLIVARGYARDKDLVRELEGQITRWSAR